MSIFRAPAARVAKRVTIDQVKNGHTYAITDPNTGLYGAVRAEVQEEWTEVHPRSVIMVMLGGTLRAGAIRSDYIIEEV